MRRGDQSISCFSTKTRLKRLLLPITKGNILNTFLSGGKHPG
jgi:hypothetical protein